MSSSSRSAPPPLPREIEPESELSGASGVASGTWAVAGVIFLGVFAAIAAWLYRHNQERKPLDFWGFDSHRIIQDCPSVKATLIKPDPLVLTPQTPGHEIWHDDLFMIIENRFLVVERADVSDRPEFQVQISNGQELKKALEKVKGSKFPDDLEITNDAQLGLLILELLGEKPQNFKELAEVEIKVKHDDVHPDKSLRRPLRENAGYDWKSFPWSQEPQWRYALTFAKTETTNFGTKHELKRTFTFTLVFDVTCRWVTLQSVEKLTALQPHLQQRLKQFFLEVFPESDVLPVAAPSATPTATSSATPVAAGTPPTPAGSPTAVPAPSAAPTPSAASTPSAAPTPSPPMPSAPTGTAPAGTGMTLSPVPTVKEEPATTPIGIPSLTTPAAGPTPPLTFSPSPLLQPSSATPLPTALPAGTSGATGPIMLPPLPTTTGTAKP